MNKIKYFGTSSFIELTDAELYGGVKFQYDLFEGEQIELGNTPSASIKFRCDRKIPIGRQLQYYHNEKLINVFTVTDCKRDTATELYDITAYDRMIEFNMDVSEWSQNLTFPITLQSLFTSLVQYVCGGGSSWNGLNGTYQITAKTWNDGNLTGRLILKYIAQMAGGYACFNISPQINRLTFNTQQATVNLTNNAWKTRTIAEYTCPVIDKVWVGAEDGDIGYTSGTGNNALKIIDNPLFYGDNAQAIQTAVDNIYAEVHALPAYSPMEIELFDMPDTYDYRNNGLNLVTFNTTKNNVTTTSIITNTYWDNSGAKYTSKGLANRDAVRNYVDNKTYETNAKYNKLTRDINETKSEIANLDGDVSTLTQTVNGLTVTVSKKISTYSQAAEPTEKSSGDLWYYTGTTTSTMTNGKWYRWNGSTWVEVTDSEVDTNASNISTLQQTATSLTSRITNAEGDINEIEQTMEGVAFTSSLADGTTLINGGCIRTGTIDADKANIINLTASDITMTGQLTWNDFNNDTQSRIEEGKYYDSDVRSYLSDKYQITSTTADKAMISSPHIVGGLIEGDTLKVYNEYKVCDDDGNTRGYIGASYPISGVEIKSNDEESFLLVTDTYCRLQSGESSSSPAILLKDETSSISLIGKIHLNDYSYGSTLPTSGNFEGRLFFKI